VATRAIIVTTGYLDSSVEELQSLLATLGVTVSEVLWQGRRKPDRKYYLGKGKMETLAKLIDLTESNLVVVNDEITSAQAKKMEELLKVPIKDRTQVVLDIFARHAFTEDGKIQVELARLQYELPRLIGRGKEMSRLGGGTGTRGPGEQRLEEQRRQIKKRISVLRKNLDKIEKERAIQRNLRNKVGLPSVAVAGYTNAGKSSLVNVLSGSQVHVEDEPFATLSPAIRRVKLPMGRVILIKDTVGFIRNVPHTVVEAFKSTLEEITTCDLVLLVMDASDVDISSKMKACLDVLSEIGASDIRRILVFNKVDLCSSSRLRALSDAFPEAVFISCKSGYGIDFLLARIQNTILANEDQIELRVVPDKLSILESHKEKVSMNIEGFEEGLFIVKVKGKKWLIEHILSQLDGGMKK